MTDELDRDARLLRDELREDPGDVDEVALRRLSRRLDASLLPSRAARLDPPRARWLGGARAGVAAALLVGSALGAGGHALVSFVADPAPRVPPSIVHPLPAAARSAPGRATRAPSTAQTSSAEPAVEPVPATPATNPQPSLPRAATPPSTASSGPDFEAELRELESARVALANGKAQDALVALRTHAQRYPRSMLKQERDAMRVKALVAGGSGSEARAAASAFRNTYPSSLLLDSVERAIATIP